MFATKFPTTLEPLLIIRKNSAVLKIGIIKVERSAESDITCLKIEIENDLLTLFPFSPLGPFSPLSP